MSKSSILALTPSFFQLHPCENLFCFLPYMCFVYVCVCVCFLCVCKLISVLSRSSVVTDNVVYLLSSSVDDEIRKSVFAQTWMYVCSRAKDKLGIVPLSLSDRVLMLIPMVNSPEKFHRKLIKPLSIIYSVPAFGHSHKHTNTVCECDSCWHVPDFFSWNVTSHWETSRPEHFPSNTGVYTHQWEHTLTGV